MIEIQEMIAADVADIAALERLCVRRPELTRSYLTALNGVTITLAEDYCRRDEIEAAYFPYIIRKYRLLDGNTQNVRL